MAVDGQGLNVTGPAEGVAAYDRAIEYLIRFRPEVVDAAAAAAGAGTVLGSVLGAYRECSTYAWHQRALLLSRLGDLPGAVAATAREGELTADISAAIAAEPR